MVVELDLTEGQYMVESILCLKFVYLLRLPR